MRFYDKPLKSFLFNDLSAVEEHDHELIYFFEKGYMTVLGEFEHEKYGGVKPALFSIKRMLYLYQKNCYDL